MKTQRYEQLLFQHGIHVTSKSPDDKGENVSLIESQMGKSPHSLELLIDLNKWLFIMNTTNDFLVSYLLSKMWKVEKNLKC